MDQDYDKTKRAMELCWFANDFDSNNRPEFCDNCKQYLGRCEKVLATGCQLCGRPLEFPFHICSQCNLDGCKRCGGGFRCFEEQANAKGASPDFESCEVCKNKGCSRCKSQCSVCKKNVCRRCLKCTGCCGMGTTPNDACRLDAFHVCAGCYKPEMVNDFNNSMKTTLDVCGWKHMI